MDRNELKIQALLEKISSLTTTYENQIAEYRVDITILQNELSKVREELEIATRHADEAGQDVPQETEDTTN